jgi:hypothetical protein
MQWGLIVVSSRRFRETHQAGCSGDLATNIGQAAKRFAFAFSVRGFSSRRSVWLRGGLLIHPPFG